eukprot:gene18704-25227_t
MLQRNIQSLSKLGGPRSRLLTRTNCQAEVNPFIKPGKRMALSKYEYVKKFELDDTLLPGCWIVVRIDGKGFTKFCDAHQFEKPNDKRGLDLMDTSARAVMQAFPDVRMAYGESDEYSFLIAKNSELYGRRSSKIVSLLTSCFTSAYVRFWNDFFSATEGTDSNGEVISLTPIPLTVGPMFDGRAVVYPDEKIVRDYFAWRQVDTHVNNQYDTVFWALVNKGVFWALVNKGGLTPQEAQSTLKGTLAPAKNEILFGRFGINYNALPEQYKKGSIIVRERKKMVVKHKEDGTPVEREKAVESTMYCDIGPLCPTRGPCAQPGAPVPNGLALRYRFTGDSASSGMVWDDPLSLSQSSRGSRVLPVQYTNGLALCFWFTSAAASFSGMPFSSYPWGSRMLPLQYTQQSSTLLLVNRMLPLQYTNGLALSFWFTGAAASFSGMLWDAFLVLSLGLQGAAFAIQPAA